MAASRAMQTEVARARRRVVVMRTVAARAMRRAGARAKPMAGGRGRVRRRWRGRRRAGCLGEAASQALAARESLDVRAGGEARSARLSHFHGCGLASGQKQPAGGYRPLDVKAREDKVDRVARGHLVHRGGALDRALGHRTGPQATVHWVGVALAYFRQERERRIF